MTQINTSSPEFQAALNGYNARVLLSMCDGLPFSLEGLLAAAIEAYNAAKSSPWQPMKTAPALTLRPIESAPKWPNSFLGYTEMGSINGINCINKEGVVCSEYGYPNEWVTQWLPLPQPIPQPPKEPLT